MLADYNTLRLNVSRYTIIIDRSCDDCNEKKRIERSAENEVVNNFSKQFSEMDNNGINAKLKQNTPGRVTTLSQ